MSHWMMTRPSEKLLNDDDLRARLQSIAYARTNSVVPPWSK